MRKLQQFYILKFDSERLKESDYRINITLNEARENNELVSIGENEVIRTLFRLQNRRFDADILKQLISDKRKIKKMPDSIDNRNRLLNIEKEIDAMLFVPEIISVKFSNKIHYKRIIQKGLYINGKSYVRLLAGSGNLRRNTVFFCDENVVSALKKILNNNRDETNKIVQSKYSAYFALSNSATYQVSYPKFCVVKDYEIKKDRLVDFIVDSKHDLIETRNEQIPTNFFDGQGLISPRLSKKWAEELEIDYTPSSFIIRSIFIKGMVCTFDFHKFAKDVAERNVIIDVWGNKVNIDDIDLILTESQFKLWSSYKSLKDYTDNISKNGLQFGISRVSPKNDKTTSFTNYQYLQVLNLESEDEIRLLCKDTVDWLNGVILNRNNYTLLYLLGELVNREFDAELLSKINDSIVSAIVVNKEVMNDPYVKSHIYRSLNKVIKESYLGALIVDGNFSIMISDPYGLAQHALGLEVTGLLNDGEHYSNFWNERDVKVVAAARSPLTHQSEMNILHLQSDYEKKYWYQYIKSGIIYPAGSIDCMLHADSDFDGDLVMTTNNQQFINGAQGGIPVTYVKKSADKVEIDDDKLWMSDSAGMNSKVGFITNLSSTYHCLLSSFDKESKEYKAIQNRLKLLRFHQGQEIDKQKGIIIDPFPDHWAKWTRKKDGMSEEEIIKIDFDNKIIADKRPYFMRYLYEDYNLTYKKYIKTYENYCISKFGVSIEELKKISNQQNEMIEFLDKFNRYNPLIENNCIMNRISSYMEQQIKILRSDIRSGSFNYFLLMDKDVEIMEQKMNKMLELFEEYKSHKRNRRNGSDALDNMNKYITKIKRLAYRDISSNGAELATMAVKICYEIFPNANKDFCWKIFGGEIVENIIKNTQEDFVTIPMMCDFGDILYLGKHYREVKIAIKNNFG